MSENSKLVPSVPCLTIQPERITTTTHVGRRQSSLEWMTLHYALRQVKLRKVGPWIKSIRDDLQKNGATVREMKPEIHFLGIDASPDQDCNVHMKVSVNPSEQLQMQNETFIAGAREIINRMRSET